jgi:pyruvate dehydrogenase E1 component alpha subunit
MANALSGEAKEILQFFRSMVRIRLFERKVNELFLKGLVPGTIHLYAGQEAIAVGVCSTLLRDDVITSTHRPHGHAIAKGLEPKHLFAEILGKRTGCCKGRGGSMHVGNMEKGMLPASAIVGAGIPIAAGVALSFTMRKQSHVAVSFFGDGATNEGAFCEGLNLAAVWKLPVVFICENNLYGVSTSIADTALLKNLSERAAGFGIPGCTVDGNNVEEIHSAAYGAVSRAREGKGPTLIECKTYRHWGHSRSDPATYRPKKEVDAWLARDPLVITRRRLESLGVAGENCDRIEHEEADKITSAAEYAISSREPSRKGAFRMVWAT